MSLSELFILISCVAMWIYFGLKSFVSLKKFWLLRKVMEEHEQVDHGEIITRISEALAKRTEDEKQDEKV